MLGKHRDIGKGHRMLVGKLNVPGTDLSIGSGVLKDN
jgi:hypothetical protein